MYLFIAHKNIKSKYTKRLKESVCYVGHVFVASVSSCICVIDDMQINKYCFVLCVAERILFVYLFMNLGERDIKLIR